MKKIFFSFLAIAALASCAKTEAVFTQDNSEIKIAPVTAMTTKAQYGVMNGTYNPDEDFSVFAYWANEPAGSRFTADQTGAGAYLNNVTFTNKGQFWGGETTQYWPKNGSLRFAAYSPAEITMTHNLATDVYTLADFTYVDNFANSYDILVAPTSESYTAQTAAQNVSVVFEHALSWLSFNVMSTAAANGAFIVHSVTVDNVATQGTMVADMTTGVKDWTVVDESKKAITAYAGNADVYTASKSLDQKDNLVLPQATTTVTITFTQKAKNDAPALANQVLTIPLTLDADQPWEAGKKYTYTIVFDLDEILINPSVEDWDEVIVPEIDATATEAANQEELQAAVAAGRNVRLTDNINLTKSIVIGNSVVTKAAGPVSVVIDLNGKNIIAESTDAIVVDNGASLEINGNGKVWAATDDKSSANAVWVKHGNVTINGGDYYVGKDNTTRNDCIYIGAADYVADAATKVSTVTINGGKFEAAAQEYNQYWVLNINDKFTSSRFYVKGGEFVNFDPSNNVSEGDGTNFLAKGYASYELKAGVWTVVSKEAETVVNTEAALADAAAQGGKVVLGADITLNTTINVAGTLTIDLNGKTVTNKVDNTNTDVFVVNEGGNLTINGNGTVAAVTGNDGYAVISKGTLTINGGTFTSGLDTDGYQNAVIYANHNDAVIEINGGSFRCADADETLPANRRDYRYTINKKGSTQEATISIKGGNFYKFNPGSNLAENPTQTFLATGYKAVANGDWFTVMAE